MPPSQRPNNSSCRLQRPNPIQSLSETVEVPCWSTSFSRSVIEQLPSKQCNATCLNSPIGRNRGQILLFRTPLQVRTPRGGRKSCLLFDGPHLLENSWRIKNLVLIVAYHMDAQDAKPKCVQAENCEGRVVTDLSSCTTYNIRVLNGRTNQ